MERSPVHESQASAQDRSSPSRESPPEPEPSVGAKLPFPLWIDTSSVIPSKYMDEHGAIPHTSGSPLSPGLAARVFRQAQNPVSDAGPSCDVEDEINELDYQDFAGRAAE